MSQEIGITVNGDVRQVPEGSLLPVLLTQLGLEGQTVLVERNGLALFPRDFATTTLASGDRLEIIRIAAGG